MSKKSFSDYAKEMQKTVVSPFETLMEELGKDHSEYQDAMDDIKRSLTGLVSLLEERDERQNAVKDFAEEMIESGEDLSFLNPKILEGLCEMHDIDCTFHDDCISLEFYAEYGKDCTTEIGGYPDVDLEEAIKDFINTDWDSVREDEVAQWANLYDRSPYFQGLELEEVLSDVREEYNTLKALAEDMKQFMACIEKQKEDKEIKNFGVNDGILGRVFEDKDDYER